MVVGNRTAMGWRSTVRSGATSYGIVCGDCSCDKYVPRQEAEKEQAMQVMAVEPNTGYYAKVVADSVNPDGVRLTTLEICFPRFILAEFNTHRMLSRNSASSRAIPVAKQLERINKYPFVPEAFPMNRPGMSATEFVYPGCGEYVRLKNLWLKGRDAAVETATALMDAGVHKQTANRVLEPYMHHTVVVTATDWDNFYNLRISPHAQPEINKIAVMMREAMDESAPNFIDWGGFHLPYVTASDFDNTNLSSEDLKKISAGRCAAVTLLNQNKKDISKDIARTEGLIFNGHMSPLEHPATADGSTTIAHGAPLSNFDISWRQYRKEIVGEAVYTNE